MLVGMLVSQIEADIGEKIDFRRDVYISNPYMLSPVMDYDKGLRIILSAIGILNTDKMNINLFAKVEQLRTERLKDVLLALIEESESH